MTKAALYPAHMIEYLSLFGRRGARPELLRWPRWLAHLPPGCGGRDRPL